MEIDIEMKFTVDFAGGRAKITRHSDLSEANEFRLQMQGSWYVVRRFGNTCAPGLESCSCESLMTAFKVIDNWEEIIDVMQRNNHGTRQPMREE